MQQNHNILDNLKAIAIWLGNTMFTILAQANLPYRALLNLKAAFGKGRWKTLDMNLYANFHLLFPSR